MAVLKPQLSEFFWTALFTERDMRKIDERIQRLASLTDDDGDLRVLETLQNCSRWMQEGLSRLANGTAPLMPPQQYAEQERAVSMLERSVCEKIGGEPNECA